MNKKNFQEPLDTAVITTKYIVFGNSPILYVFHDEDGVWQFHGPEENINEDDAAIIRLDEMIKIDDSILSVSDLPVGWQAMRKDIYSDWRIVSPY
ncbi:MAG: hypothetical protein A2W93_09610 [Bacteroidetes bacterium GWF2_43_63]|nr:MAG: hypothetical protein A2W94_07095 [Bacteroidetes bacterium GWE2_42_42]OFY54563.1 MAG: hypothetical protein A2W93_09610 [Bacteroidetes bacterium GWF2_43_63]HBG70628.1 hypothetical protein [Bacteroidales bacterium]HCB60924.1 hypothetical protein [Bacteroidales bacterium]